MSTTTVHLPEVCDELSAAIVDIEQTYIDDNPLNVQLQNAVTCLRQAINTIDAADREMAKFHQARVDQGAVDAIVTALQANYGSDSNAGPANGMLADIASPGGASMILQVIRSAGYVVSPEPSF